MSLVFAATPAHYTTPNVPLYWDVAHADVTVDSNDGYAGGPAWTASSQGAYVKRILRGVSESAGGIGARIKVSSLPSSEQILLGLTDSSGTLLAAMTLLADGHIAVYQGDLAVLLAISTDTITTATQLRLGFRAVLDNSGSIEACLNDVVLATASGVDLGTTPWSGIYVGCHSNIYVSHVYAREAYELSPALLVDAVFDSNADLDDIDPDGDATTEVLTTYGDTFSDLLDTPPDRRVVYGLHLQSLVKSVNVIDGHVPQVSVGGSAFSGNRQTLVLGEYRAVDDCWAVNPQTSLPWTTDEIAAAAVGGEAVP